MGSFWILVFIDLNMSRCGLNFPCCDLGMMIPTQVKKCVIISSKLWKMQ